ncbi:MAG: DUF2848 domain-containing protein [Rhodospirillales bacterium]|nr:DUF2848 domain-containing protein [Rhodospirillales bacterium]MDP6646619.1 DUF2848 domain-containing protein [Rhodospirillales bacterium]MDP6841907.1 DUF2848 domain-containing protein [Rhodospirillales bacterium]
MAGKISLGLRMAEAGDIDIVIENLIIGGLTGRDREAIEAHLAELAEIGVERPSSIPLFYRVAADMLSTADDIQVLGEETSGEVEFVLLGTGEGMLVGAGSDHTDRKVEAYSVPVSKQMCAKVVAPEVWRYDEVADHFEQLILRSWAVDAAGKRLYQEGAVSGFLSPGEVIPLCCDGADTLPPGTALYGGTLAAIGGVKPADRFEFELDDPVLGRTISHGYDVSPLPVVT